jgi:toxin ParE1/3/4
MTLEVAWHPFAELDLRGIYDWIAGQADPATAREYTRRIEAKCDTLGDFPHRGTPRDHLEPGLRTVTFERRVVIVYRTEQHRVLILRLIHTARDIGAQFGRD